MIKVNGYTAGVTYSAGGGIIEPSIELLESYISSGTSTFSVVEEGLYLFLVSNSLSGSRGITLPSGRTPIIDEDIETTYGSTVVVVELEVGDSVTLEASASSWAAFSKQVYLLKDLTVDSLYGKQANNDGSFSYSVPGTDKFLVIGTCFGRTSADYYNETEESFGVRSIENKSTVNTLTKIYLDAGANIPLLAMYGYDGGGVNYLALNVVY